MTIADLKNRIFFLTKTTANDYSAANMIINMNRWYNYAHEIILRSQDGWIYDDVNQTALPIITQNTAVGQEQTLPTGTIQVRQVEITYDGTNWYNAALYSRSESSDTTFATTIAANFSTSSPYYELVGNKVLMYPSVPTVVTNGIKFTVDRGVKEFTTSDLSTGTVVPGIDINFHDILAVGPSYDWAVAKGAVNANQLLLMLQDLEAKMRVHYGSKQNGDGFILKSALPNYE